MLHIYCLWQRRPCYPSSVYSGIAVDFWWKRTGNRSYSGLLAFLDCDGEFYKWSDAPHRAVNRVVNRNSCAYFRFSHSFDGFMCADKPLYTGCCTGRNHRHYSNGAAGDGAAGAAGAAGLAQAKLNVSMLRSKIVLITNRIPLFLTFAPFTL